MFVSHGSRRHRLFGPAALASALAAMMLVAGCGGSSSDNGSSSAATPAKTADSGTETAATGGGTKPVPKKTIGLVNILAASATTGAMQQAVKDAGAQLGWDVKTIDGQGDPSKMAAGVQSLVTQKVDAIITITGDPEVVRKGLEAAKAQNIPTIQIGGPIPPNDLYTASYEQNNWAMTSLAAKYMAARMGYEGEVGVFDNNLVYGFKARMLALKAVFALYPKIKIVATQQLDLANLGPSTEKATVDMLRAHPNIKSIWSMADPAFTPALNGVRQAGKQDSTFVMGWTAYKPYAAALRSNSAAGALPHAWTEETGWIAIDQLAKHFTNGTPIDPAAVEKNPVPITLYTKDNLPSADGDPPPPVDFKTKYEEQWKSEFKLH